MYFPLLLLCSALSCVYAVFWWSGRRARRLLKGLPTYPTLPFIGNLHRMLGDGVFLAKVVEDISKISEDADLPFVAWIGPRPVIVVAAPDDVKAVTYAFVEKPYYYSFAREWVGDGLVTAPGHIWKRSIKSLAGIFTGTIVEGYQDVFNAQAQKLVDKLKLEVGKEPFDVLEKYLAYTTLETICQIAFGVPRISDSVVSREYYRSFRRVFQLFVQRGTNLLLHLDWVYRLTPSYREAAKCIAVLHDVSRTVMTERLKEREILKKNGSVPSNNNSANEKMKFKSALDILLDLQEVDGSFTTQQIRNEVDTLIIGGQETIAITVFMALLQIGSREDIQNKLHAEIKNIFGDSRRPVEKEDLVLMTYTEAVINETLRMYPPVPVVMREADRDLEIKSCTIPKGAGCAVNAWCAGRSNKVWGPDAKEFKPERWIDCPDLGKNNSASFLAFSYGKRACIGRRYAIPFLKTLMAYIIRDLRVSSTIEQLQLDIDATLKGHSGHLITLDYRH